MRVRNDSHGRFRTNIDLRCQGINEVGVRDDHEIILDEVVSTSDQFPSPIKEPSKPPPETQQLSAAEEVPDSMP